MYLAGRIMPSVSVIIPTYNRAQKVVRAISSVLCQTFNDYEIIVIDDGSTDSTKTAMAQFDECITYIVHSSNLGVSAARNTGIRRSSATFIAFLDSDDYWLPKKLAAHMEFFKTHPYAQACQTDEIWIRKGHRVNPKKRHLKPSGDIFEPSLELCLVSPSAVMLRRSLLEEVGLFDEDLMACEDYDLWLRISCKYPVYLIRQKLVFKDGGRSDQLSYKHKGMDRFRIKSIVKLVKSGRLNEGQLISSLDELASKCRIYGNGCLKRGKLKEGSFYLRLPERIIEELSLGFINS
jgi:glycosyltransferase involved in cell wall biosynthesis